MIFLKRILLFFVVLGNQLANGDGNLGTSIGSSAASKLLRMVVDNQLRSQRFIEVGVNSTNQPWFRKVAHLHSRNRIDMGTLEVNFLDDKQIELEGHDMHINSTTLVKDAALPIFFLDHKSILMSYEVKRAYLRLHIDQSAVMRIEKCEMEQGDISLNLENSYLLNLVLKTIPWGITDDTIRDKACGFLLDAVVDLRDKYTLELAFKSLIPDKFARYLKNDNILLHTRIQSIIADSDQIMITAIMEWNSIDPSTTPAEHTSVANTNFLFSDFFEASEESQPSIQNEPSIGPSPAPVKQTKSPSSLPSNNNSNRDRLLIWVEDKLLNNMLAQFNWDFQWINESIQMSSPKLPEETRSFFEVLCPQCFFIVTVNADGLPKVEIRDKSIIISNKNRIVAAVLNPTLGKSGEKRTAIDLSMELKLKFVPQIQDGTFRTHFELLERKIDIKGGSAPSKWYEPIAELIQNFIAEDIWPLLQRTLEPLVYQDGIQLPSRCGFDPKSSQLHFEENGRIGLSANINLDEWSNITQCSQQFKNGLPDTSKIFTLPKGRTNDRRIRKMIEN